MPDPLTAVILSVAGILIAGKVERRNHRRALYVRRLSFHLADVIVSWHWAGVPARSRLVKRNGVGGGVSGDRRVGVRDGDLFGEEVCCEVAVRQHLSCCGDVEVEVALWRSRYATVDLRCWN